MKKIVCTLLFLSASFTSYSQINPDHIEIIRDNYGGDVEKWKKATRKKTSTKKK